MTASAPLDDVIGGKTSVRVLRVLSLFPEKEFTGRQLAQMAGGAPSKVIQELGRLREAGIVTRQTHGRTHAWRANREHVVFRLLRPAFEAERDLPGVMLATLRKGVRDERVTRAILFGSFARGDETARSDVDLLVLTRRASDVEDVRKRLDHLAIRLGERFGAQLSAIVHPESDLPRLRKTALLGNVRAEGRVLRGDMP
ncbi:MAG: hypothetical protein QOE90_763 [Thermoplasmata archaeon]|jgi:predicted nucleotidyltransferase|nr:hypothetical protein [Thermoplasmata archaeon]